jgi:site-specific DNA recombinase
MGAHEIETLICARIKEAIGMLVQQRIAQGDLSGGAIEQLRAHMTGLSEQLNDPRPAIARAALLKLVRHIDVGEGQIAIVIRPAAIDARIAADEHIVTMPIGFVRSGMQVRLILPPADTGEQRLPNPSLLKLVAQAFTAQRVIAQCASLDEAAVQLKCGREYLADLIRTSYLSPRIIQAILDGTQPASLTRKQLVQTNRIPLDWRIQETIFGFG